MMVDREAIQARAERASFAATEADYARMHRIGVSDYHCRPLQASAADVPALLAALAEAEAKVARVEAAYDLQCGHPLKRGDYVDVGAYMAHLWWQKVLGGILHDGGGSRD